MPEQRIEYVTFEVDFLKREREAEERRMQLLKRVRARLDSEMFWSCVCGSWWWNES
jgi:hypothetical protein